MRKVALITGASRGIGRACARLFAENGYTVLINYFRSEQAARSLLDELLAKGCDARLYRADVADSAQVEAMCRQALAEFHHVDVLINNAAIAQQALFTDLTDKDWRRMMAVNLDGAFYCARALLPGMISRRSGSIVNISSMWGQVGASCEVSYSTAKAGLIGLTKALAREVAPSNVRVNCLCPGVIDTDMNAHLTEENRRELAEETPMGRLGTPEEVAGAALFLCGEGASFITGQVLGVSGGLIT